MPVEEERAERNFLLKKNLEGKIKIDFDILKRRRDFKRIYKEGSYIQNKYVGIYVLVKDEAGDDVKVGFNISKKIGSAVARNRIKRMLKEILRKIDFSYTNSIDILFIARKEICETGFWKLKGQIENSLNSFFCKK